MFSEDFKKKVITLDPLNYPLQLELEHGNVVQVESFIKGIAPPEIKEELLRELNEYKK